jgi:hypothetical protein
MAYNLPPPWDPGYALPANVDDEGLERRAFVTKQMPRGTYDNPAVGTAGLAVPQYIKDEGYGQGTFTTKWQPSGSYNGPRVPHWLNRRPKVVRQHRLPGGGNAYTVQPLGDDDAPMPAMFDAYGQRAAQELLARVATLPPQTRQRALRAIMDQVDKSLWKRTGDITRRYVAQGVPVVQAFPQALARALSTGVVAELIDTGMRRSAPQANSLLGLGCYGPHALGAIRVSHVSGTVTGTATPTTTTGVLTAPAASDPRVAVAGISFVPSTLTRTWAVGTPSSTIANRAAPPDVQINDPRDIPAETIAFLRDKLLTPTGDATRSFCSVDATTGFPEWDASTWFGSLGIDCDSKMNLHPLWYLRTAIGPFGAVKNPVTGETMVLHIQLGKKDLAKPSDPTANPLVLKFWLSKTPDPSLFQSLVNTLMWVPVHVIAPITAPIVTPVVKAGIDLDQKVRDVVSGALDKLGDLSCSLVQKPGVGAAAGAVAGTYMGAGPVAGATAGQAGAQIAQKSCGGQPPPPSPFASLQSSILPLAMLGGVAVVGALLLFGGDKKKRESHE